MAYNNYRNALIAGLILVMFAGACTATTNIVTNSVEVTGNVGWPGNVIEIAYLNNTDSLVGNMTIHGSYNYAATKRYWGTSVSASIYIIPTDEEVLLYEDFRKSSPQDPPDITASGSVGYTRSLAANMDVKLRLSVVDSYEAPPGHGTMEAYVIFTSDPIYHISGTTACANDVSIYYNNSGSWVYMINDSLDDNYYKFNITTGIEFKIVFDDGHTYVFESTGNEEYNHNACTTTKYRFEESCGNLIRDSEGFYIEKIGGAVHVANDFYEASGILTISESPADSIYVSAIPFSGEMGWFLSPITNDTTYNLTNPFINWGLKVVVQNASTDALIDNAVVRVNQSCYCTSGYSVRQKHTVGGMVAYNDMSLQDASLWVYATGYKICDESTTGYNVFLSGKSNLSSKTWIVELVPSSSNNTSTWYETAHTTDIHFKDVNGNVTTKILDTDAYVRLYYQNNNSGGEDMTLKFQSSSTHTYFIDEDSWSIPHDESGYKEIATSYFTPWDYSYRAVMYNSSIYGWNLTIPLTVRNGTKETEQHYQNLTTHLWFLNEEDGKIDYREDMDIGVHACSNNTTLMTVDVELYKDNDLLCYKNLTASDFIGADFPYYYLYEPQYSYVSGSNYSVRMYGFDRTLLETDYVDCMTDDTVRKNKLTIQVKDRAGTPLTEAYIFLEDWGSLPTGSLSYNAYEGLNDGAYRYKASKAGYTTTGWDTINMSGSDESVTYTLTEEMSAGSLTSEKMADDDIKAIFYPCIFFLLIMILIGGLMYVVK